MLQGQWWPHLQAGRYWAEFFCGCTFIFMAQRRETALTRKKRHYFHLKAGLKNARQFVSGHKATHSRQKGKLYQCNFPRQTSHNSEHPFAVSCKELPFSCCNLRSFISPPPSPPLLSLPITRPIHGHPMKCPICRGGCKACFRFQLLDLLSQGPSPR